MKLLTAVFLLRLTFPLKMTVLFVAVILAAALVAGPVGADEPVSKNTENCSFVTPYLVHCADEGKWYVQPSNFASDHPDYGLVDADRLQAAIDLASEGDTIVVTAGTWVFAKLAAVDFDINTAQETFKHYEDWLLPTWDFAFATPDHHQDINIDKSGLTITGETTTGPAGERVPTAIITTPLEIDDHGIDFWDGYNGSFLINAPHVTLKNLRIEKFVHPIWAYSPGFDIKHNHFVDCGFGHYLNPNVELTYPNWPDTSVAVRSYFRHNVLLNNGQPPHVVGSEVVVADNHFDYRNYGMFIFPWGDYNDPDNWNRPEPYPINWDLGQNNLVKDNYFNCNGSYPGIGIWNVMSDLRNNQVIGNTFEDCGVGVWIADYESSAAWSNTATKVLNNTFRNIAWFAVNPFSFDDPTGVKDCSVSGNVFENVGYEGWAIGAGIWAETGVVNCQFKNNDFTLSGIPGIDGGQLAVFFDGWVYDGVYYGPKGNLVNEKYFPEGTNLCDQFFDASMTLENPAGLNNVLQWARLCGTQD
jgi:hypothetical protein